MGPNLQRALIGTLAMAYVVTLVFVQWNEVVRGKREAGLAEPRIVVPATSRGCVDCHVQTTPGLVAHWEGSTHALRGIGCLDCHQAHEEDADAFPHWGTTVATVVTPLDCARCHPTEAAEFAASHHAKGGNILASLDNFLAETVEGARVPFDPHSPTPGMAVQAVDGLASAALGCMQCHGSKVGLLANDGGMITVDDLQPDESGRPTATAVADRIQRDDTGRVIFHASTWPNTGIGRINLDGSLGSCSACHSRHDFSPRRARQPENCAKCHLGPDHPQKEIFEESKHGVAYRDLMDEMNLDADRWVLGEDYSQAPTCATCHMSANTRNGRTITHDPGIRISWTNRPPVSLRMDTDREGRIVTETDPAKRAELIVDTADAKRRRMANVCLHCHTQPYVSGFYEQYDDLVILYNEKFAKPGQRIMAALREAGLLSPTQFDEEIEWTWFYLWHHEGRRARHGASMMAPDYTHWHGMFEVAERFYMELVPQARELIHRAEGDGLHAAAEQVTATIEAILERPEHRWFVEGAIEQTRAIERAMESRYGVEGTP